MKLPQFRPTLNSTTEIAPLSKTHTKFIEMMGTLIDKNTMLGSVIYSFMSEFEKVPEAVIKDKLIVFRGYIDDILSADD